MGLKNPLYVDGRFEPHDDALPGAVALTLLGPVWPLDCGGPDPSIELASVPQVSGSPSLGCATLGRVIS